MAAGLIGFSTGITSDGTVELENQVSLVEGTGLSYTNGREVSVYHDGTSMAAVVNATPGDRFGIRLVLDNQSGSKQSQQIVIQAPEEFVISDGSAQSGENILRLVQVDRTLFHYTVDADARGDRFKDGLEIQARLKSSAPGGSYHLVLTTESLSGGSN